MFIFLGLKFGRLLGLHEPRRVSSSLSSSDHCTTDLWESNFFSISELL